MNKLLKGMLVLTLVATGLRAATNKTFMLPRSHGVNLAMEYTTWNELLQTKDEDRFGAHFQITPFYMDSADDDDVGKYFGVANKHIFNLNSTAATDAIGSYMIHDGGVLLTLAGLTGVAIPAAQTNNVATLKLEPEQTAYGVRIDYYQDLKKLLKGLYFKATLPIVHVENDMQLDVTGVNAGANALIAPAATAAVAKAQFENFFRGNTLAAAAGAAAGPISNIALGGVTFGGAQAALTHAKINGEQNETGVADIDLVLGYKVLDKEKYHLSLNLGLTIPTGTDPDGVWAFEPVVGNGEHWAFGGGFDFGAKLWEDEDQNLKLTAALNYRYLFESTEKRTIGIRNAAGSLPWGHYYLIGTLGANRSVTTLLPAANVLTRDLDVEPGSQLDAIIDLAYNNGGLNVVLGYNLFWKDDEDVKLKAAWYADGTYGIAHIDQTMGDAQLFNVTALSVAVGNPGGDIGLNSALGTNIWAIDVDAAATPSQVTHKIYGGVGYIFKDWEYPLGLNLSAHYEFAGDDGIENWGLWVKLMIAF